ncbi:hypothetical protein SPHINGO8BC_80080 [Sphingobacterium multivorum]|uniref:Uncharacterized protein n=1 Tax=Sphingobacterium multivorum TaxID=28454 RepID=A0A654DNZ6_SPHMU|nr:hypothetical protein SPHINGO8BC_80080 [Sphingobacterium multivorum]
MLHFPDNFRLIFILLIAQRLNGLKTIFDHSELSDNYLKSIWIILYEPDVIIHMV